ncbi:hypothetical protein [Spirosoma sp. KNUC1025]|uniref:hypothetical protein n=1 Tax=Spirosoma sp. KNUC1025 TaxID=2894082 RepID=UPI00386E85CE|nr:hypothetical protein LN737_00625 [Spirosoma sp. KNUC1025]
MNTGQPPKPTPTDTQVPTYLRVQMSFTTQPFGQNGASDFELLHSALAHYRSFLWTRIKPAAGTSTDEVEQVRTQIEQLNDLLFDLQAYLIEADQTRVRAVSQPS